MSGTLVESIVEGTVEETSDDEVWWCVPGSSSFPGNSNTLLAYSTDKTSQSLQAPEYRLYGTPSAIVTMSVYDTMVATPRHQAWIRAQVRHPRDVRFRMPFDVLLDTGAGRGSYISVHLHVDAIEVDLKQLICRIYVYHP